MKPPYIATAVLASIVSAGAALAAGSSSGVLDERGVATLSAMGSIGEAAALQAKGRYKRQGENCVWDAGDSGPNQCAPRTAGRFKKSGESCVWDAKDNGPDQCTPPLGRWKTSGNDCLWDAKDSGPHQCNPRQPRK